jgi:hypothetical protein
MTKNVNLLQDLMKKASSENQHGLHSNREFFDQAVRKEINIQIELFCKSRIFRSTKRTAVLAG